MKQWGGEFHIKAMAIAFNSKIYIYNSFREPLLNKNITKEALMSARNIGFSLAYTPLTSDCCRFICGFYQSNHYTAILPMDMNSFELTPKDNLFC
jgi:hypothetical protein